MQTTHPDNSGLFVPDLESVLAQIAKPGVVFSEPRHTEMGEIITASHVNVRKGRLSARPVAVVTVASNRVTVKYIRKSQLISLIWGFLVLAILGTIPVIYAPPWRPSFNLFHEIRLLLQNVRCEE